MREKQLCQLKKLERFKIAFANVPTKISACSFANLTLEGKTQAALKMLSKNYENNVLNIYDDILTELKSKYPHAAEAKEDSLLFGPINKLSQLFS